MMLFALFAANESDHIDDVDDFLTGLDVVGEEIAATRFATGDEEELIERAARMGEVPLLLLHGERDSILGPENSHMVRALAGKGEVGTFPEADHLLAEVAHELEADRLGHLDQREAGVDERRLQRRDDPEQQRVAGRADRKSG